MTFIRFPIYMCVSVPEAEDSIEGYYEAWPFGMCKKFVRVADQRDPMEHLANMPWVCASCSALIHPIFASFIAEFRN